MPAWRAVRVVAQRGGVGRSDALEAPFVGRDEELRQLKDLFHATTREGRARLVSVVGPGGIGKTRLAWEFLKYVDGLVDRVWWHAGRSPAYGDGITFWALGEMVRGRAGLVETDDEAATRAHIATVVGEHVPDEAEAAWIESALLALLGFEAGIPPAQLFAAWRTFFERLAATSPVVMVFEDLHHADNGLLDFIDHLMEWSRGVPITVITLARPDLLEKRPDWGAGKRSFASIYLEPLPPGDMEQLLAGLVPGLPAQDDGCDRRPRRRHPAVRGRDRPDAPRPGPPRPRGRGVSPGRRPRRSRRPGDAHGPHRRPPRRARCRGSRPHRGRRGPRPELHDGRSGGRLGDRPDRARAAAAGLVRRELLVLDVDPRSPERGQYGFVQALIREVAYNTLAKKDRKVRHLAAARFFESLGTDELAGGLAGHYLAAQRLAADAAEADALAAQARLALRGAAERAAALGSHEQAITFLEQALEVTTDPADRADLHERALGSAMQGLQPDVIVRHAEAAESERRKTGDRPAIAWAVATHAQMISGFRRDPATARSMLERAWTEFADLEATPAGVELMVAQGRVSRGLDDTESALAWFERYLPIAERLGLLIPTARGILGRGVALLVGGRPREGLILLRGAHQLALTYDLAEVELNCRVLLTFYEQWGEPAIGLELGREGLEIGRRVGSRAYGFGMVGNASICAYRVGEFAWATALLDEWIGLELTNNAFAEFFVDRAILRSLRGEDASSDIEEAARLRATITDPQFESYEVFARAWAALAGGDLVGAIAHAERATAVTGYFAPLALPLGARAALWDGDAETARRLLDTLAEASYWGPALEADRTCLEAGIAALEGRPADALAGYREALRAYRQLGLAFDEALAGVDMSLLLASPEREAPDVVAAIQGARESLTRLEATPFLAILDRPRTGRPGIPGAVAPRSTGVPAAS